MTKKKKNRNSPHPKTANVRRQQTPELTKPARKRSRLLPVTGLILFGLLALAFYAYKQTPPHWKSGMYKGYNILLITIDTLRADHLPAYGYSRVKTPNLDQLAAKSLLFTNAVSHVPLTLPAHASILTGLLPIAHGLRDNGGYLDKSNTTIAEILQQNGYTTAAFVSAFVLDSRWQLDQGFQTYSDNFGLSEYQEINPRDIYRRGEETESEFEKWLADHQRKQFFCWVHLYDPHDPYDPPGIYKTEYASNPYDGEIAYTDEVFGKLRRKLEEFKIGERTILIVTGDHGESLGDHQERTHAMFLYNSTQHVPLIMYLPGVSGKRIDEVVGHVDLAPTILEFAGVKPKVHMPGASLLGLIEREPKPERYIYGESLYAELHYGWSPLQSITTRKYKYIDAPRPELYDRIQDPGETQNRFTAQPQIARVLKAELQEIQQTNSSKSNNPSRKLDSEAEEKLRALGYVTGNVVSTAESRKIDPKDKIHLARNVEEALGATLMKNYPLAVRLVEPVLREDPNLIEAQFVAGVAYAGIGQYPMAVDHFMKTIRAQPDHVRALSNMAYAYQMMGDLKSAEFWYKQVLKFDEKHTFTIMKLAQLYRQMNHPGKAASYYRQALQFFESALQTSNSAEARSAIYSTLAEIHFNAGQTELAEQAIKAAIQLRPSAPELHYNLAQILEFKKDLRGAAESYKEEINISPNNFMAFNNLGIIYVQLGLLEDAAGCFRKVIELQPADPRAYHLLASIYKKMGKDKEAEELFSHLPGKQS